MTGFRTVLRMILTLEVFLVAGVFLFSCGTPKVVYETKTEYRDSIVTVVRERLVHDTVSVEVPVEIEKIVVPDTDTSRLENSFAKSEAYVDINGFLHHSLESKPQKIDVPVEVPVTDTTTVHQTASVSEKTETKYVEVEKELTWLQKTQIYGFRCMILFALLYFLWRYRKQIWAFVRRFI